jgi:hypothetical protein
MEVTNNAVTEQINKWRGRIYNVAVTTAQKCTDPLYEVEEIEQRLRIGIWRAMEKFDPTKGMSLESWIFGQINQTAALTVEEQYHHRQDWKGDLVRTLEIDGNIDEDPDGEDSIAGLQVEDPTAVGRTLSIVGDAEVKRLKREIRQVMKQGRELTIYDKIISGEYESDQEIASELEIDFAIVGEVRFKAKVALAILVELPFKLFTKAKNIRDVAKRVATSLGYGEGEWNEKIESLLS